MNKKFFDKNYKLNINNANIQKNILKTKIFIKKIYLYNF